jgi:methionyl-tRNA formyltransferase
MGPVEDQIGTYNLMDSRMSEFRIALFGNQGHASRILDALLSRNERVVALCTRTKPPLWKRVARRAVAVPRHLGLVTAPYFYQEPLADMPDIHKLARRHGIPILPSRELHERSFFDDLSALQPDLILSAGFHRLIPDDVISIASKAAVNLHPSLLPKHRGGTPNRWIIRFGEEHCGVTAHNLDSEFDTGDIFIQRKTTVAPAVTWGELELKIGGFLESMALDIVSAAKSGHLTAQPQDHGISTYENSYSGEHQWIDWSQGAGDVRWTCLAIRPKSGGFTLFGKQQLCLWEVQECERPETGAQPGTIIEMDAAGRPLVDCGESAVRIVTMLQGGRIRPAEQLLGRLGARVGARFGGA